MAQEVTRAPPEMVLSGSSAWTLTGLNRTGAEVRGGAGFGGGPWVRGGAGWLEAVARTGGGDVGAVVGLAVGAAADVGVPDGVAVASTGATGSGR
ncbi:hypothetical protein GCM10022251_75540 [Phytohabitans flavus]